MSGDVLNRVRESISRGRVFDDSTAILRESSCERTLELQRALGMSDEEVEHERAEWIAAEEGEANGPMGRYVEAEPGAAAEPPRREHEPIAAYLRRLRNAAPRGRVLTDNTTEIVRREREQRTEELLRRSGL